MNRSLLLITVLILSSLFTSSKSSAYGSYSRSSSFGGDGVGWLVMPQGIYYFTNDTQGTTNNSTNRYIFDASAGYHFELFYLGAEFNYDLIQTSSSGNPTNSNVYKSYGVQVGIMTGGWMLLGSYFVLSTATSNVSGSPVDYTGGTGYQILGGYLWDIGSGFNIGPEFLYRSLTYTSRADGKPIGSNYTFSTMAPQIGVKYMF